MSLSVTALLFIGGSARHVVSSKFLDELKGELSENKKWRAEPPINSKAVTDSDIL